jgi:hypothetical protein
LLVVTAANLALLIGSLTARGPAATSGGGRNSAGAQGLAGQTIEAAAASSYVEQTTFQTVFEAFA